MDYQYMAYTQDKRLVSGKLSAASEEKAASLLNYGGYKVISLKLVTPFLNAEKLRSLLYRVKPKEVIMFSRQLALLLESGTDIVTALDLLQHQVTNASFKRVIGEVASDIRGGRSLSSAMSKHPRTFPEIYYRTIAGGEQGGNLDIVLRQMADYLERGATIEKKVKGALAYPMMLAGIGLIVMIIMVTVVLPSFVELYSSFGAELPLPAKIVISLSDFLIHYGLTMLLVVVGVFAVGYLYSRTPGGRYQRDKLLLKLPIIGRVIQLNELSRCCRTIALLFKVGLPLPEILTQAMRGTKNRVMARALAETQQDLIRGEGLSKPMAKRDVFLPLMVQMVGVGEETGNLDSTLATVAQSYELEADDKTSSAIGLIQPALVVVIAIVIGFLAVSLLSAMYSIYGQANLG
jgi:type IV pilus assembly protein PilC